MSIGASRDVSCPRPLRRARHLILVLLGILGVLAAPRPARAAGCHVEERPRFGLTTLDPSGGGVLAVRSEGAPRFDQFAPRPCSGDDTTGPGRTMSPPPIASLGCFVVVENARTPRIPLGDETRPDRLAWTDLARPPRSGIA